MILLKLFSRRWWWTTLLVIAAMAVMVRLGIWQFDRLAQRRAYNAQLTAQLAAAPLDVTAGLDLTNPAALDDRKAEVTGRFDYNHQIGLKNQTLNGQPGYHLVTPLLIEGSEQAILVDRGWIPYQQAEAGDWSQFDEPATGVLTGYLQKSQRRPGGGTSAPSATSQAEWYWLDIDAIQSQMPYPLLPVYLMLSPQAGRSPTALPQRVEPNFDLSEGNHLSYALQWYSFALILGVGYIFYVRKEENETEDAVPEVGETASV